MRHYLIALGLLGCTQIGHAEPDPFVSLGLFFTPVNELDVDTGLGSASPDGTGFGVRAEVGGALHVYGEYMDASLEESGVDVDVTDTRLGLSYRSHFQNGYLQASAEYVRLELDVAGSSDSDTGSGVHIGGGFNASETVTLFGRVGIISLDETDGSEFRLGANAKLNENTGLYLQYRSLMLSEAGDDLDANDLRLGLNFSF